MRPNDVIRIEGGLTRVDLQMEIVGPSFHYIKELLELLIASGDNGGVIREM